MAKVSPDADLAQSPKSDPAEETEFELHGVASPTVETIMGVSSAFKTQRSLDRLAGMFTGVGRFNPMASLRAVDMVDTFGLSRHTAALGTKVMASALEAALPASSLAASGGMLDRAKLPEFGLPTTTLATVGIWNGVGDFAAHRAFAADVARFDNLRLQEFQHAALAIKSTKDWAEWRAMDRLAHTFGIGDVLGDHIDRLGRVDRAFRQLLPESAHSMWSEHWRSATRHGSPLRSARPR